MVRSWVLDDLTGDRRTEHFTNPPQFFSPKELFHTTGVECFRIDHENFESDTTLIELKTNRGYCYEDTSCCSRMSFSEKMLLEFYTEHFHTDEEVRLVLEGSGYFDVKNVDEKWIRIGVVPGDFIIIPRGHYHRFTMDVNNFIKAKRYSVGPPIWDSYERPADLPPRIFATSSKRFPINKVKNLKVYWFMLYITYIMKEFYL